MHCKNSVTWRFLLLLSLSFLFIPFKWFISWVIASLIHELFHILSLCIFHCKINKILFDGNTVKIFSEPTAGFHKLICSLAGPIGSFGLIIFIKSYPLLAICGITQGIYNILPFFPLDGWHILNLIRSVQLRNVIKLFFSSALLIMGLYLLFRSFGIVPLLLSLFIILRDLKNTLHLCD